jgi:hypothetical protein
MNNPITQCPECTRYYCVDEHGNAFWECWQCGSIEPAETGYIAALILQRNLKPAGEA